MRPEQDEIARDAEELKKLGYAQELLREMGAFSNFALSFSIISILTGGVVLYGHGLKYGGPLIMTVGWPFASRAQPRKPIPRIGVLWHAGSADEEAIYIRALNQGFNDLGYVDGKSITLEHRFPDERPERFASMAAELAAIPVDVLVAVTQPAALAAAPERPAAAAAAVARS